MRLVSFVQLDRTEILVNPDRIISVVSGPDHEQPHAIIRLDPDSFIKVRGGLGYVLGQLHADVTQGSPIA